MWQYEVVVWSGAAGWNGVSGAAGVPTMLDEETGLESWELASTFADHSGDVWFIFERPSVDA